MIGMIACTKLFVIEDVRLVISRALLTSLISPLELKIFAGARAYPVASRTAGQSELADRLHKPQSFVAKYEGGERRLDVVEFVTVCRAIGANPAKVLRALLKL